MLSKVPNTAPTAPHSATGANSLTCGWKMRCPDEEMRKGRMKKATTATPAPAKLASNDIRRLIRSGTVSDAAAQPVASPTSGLLNRIKDKAQSHAAANGF